MESEICIVTQEVMIVYFKQQLLLSTHLCCELETVHYNSTMKMWTKQQVADWVGGLVAEFGDCAATRYAAAMLVQCVAGEALFDMREEDLTGPHSVSLDHTPQRCWHTSPPSTLRHALRQRPAQISP